MPVIAIYALIAAALFGAGYGTAWKQAQYQIITLETQRDQANVQSQSILRESTLQVEQAKVETSKRLELLTDGYNETINRINANNASIAPARMYITTDSKRCTNTLPRATSTKAATGHATATAGLQDALAGAVRIELPGEIERHLEIMGNEGNRNIATLNLCLQTLQLQVKK
jgi:hypothetical protein